MRVRTFKKWQAKGYRIKKGSKHVARTVKGKPLFKKSQVYRERIYCDTVNDGRGVDYLDYDESLGYDYL